MSRLLRLYPRSWRERYGDEMAVILASRPLRAADRLDLLVGAVDARLRERRRPTAAGTSLRVSRAVAVSTVAAGVLWVVAAGAFGIATVLPAGIGIGSLTLAILLMLAAEGSLVRAVSSRAASSLAALAMAGALLMVTGWLALASAGDTALVAGWPAYLVWFLGAMSTMLLVGLLVIPLVRRGALRASSARGVALALAVQVVTIILAGILDTPALSLLGAVVLGTAIARAGSGSAYGPAAA